MSFNRAIVIVISCLAGLATAAGCAGTGDRTYSCSYRGVSSAEIKAFVEQTRTRDLRWAEADRDFRYRREEQQRQLQDAPTYAGADLLSAEHYVVEIQDHLYGGPVAR
ncbi:MAG TPA: hypothetical protein VMZ31_00365 [Phycisphaerae bacterium]|nr:hypothetical protein [Phycisphaerae bacterium]